MNAEPVHTTDGCRHPETGAALPVDAARARILAAVPSAPPPAVARPLRDALGCVLAESVVSTFDVPAHTNSALDGYAFRADDLPATGTAHLRCIGRALAGQPYAGPLRRGDCIQVMTGAVMPAHTDSVVAQEDCERRATGSEILISIPAGQRRGQNVRQAGEDMARGDTVFTPGMRLQAAHIGVLASLGLSEIRVHRPLRVALLSTGDELRPVGRPLGAGEVYDSNRYTVISMLRRLDATPLDLGVVQDRPEALREAFTTAAREADAIVSTGGVSVGAADFVRDLLDELGSVQFWKIAMKPGRPFAFGRIRDALFFGLPGNPVAAMVAFYQFVQPALLRLGGERRPAPAVTLQLPCQSRINKRPGRTEYVRALLESDAAGQLSVRDLGRQGSGILTSMALSNCFVVLEHDRGPVEPGDLVTVQPFSGLV